MPIVKRITLYPRRPDGTQFEYQFKIEYSTKRMRSYHKSQPFFLRLKGPVEHYKVINDGSDQITGKDETEVEKAIKQLLRDFEIQMKEREKIIGVRYETKDGGDGDLSRMEFGFFVGYRYKIGEADPTYTRLDAKHPGFGNEWTGDEPENVRFRETNLSHYDVRDDKWIIIDHTEEREAQLQALDKSFELLRLRVEEVLQNRERITALLDGGTRFLLTDPKGERSFLLTTPKDEND